VPKHGWRGCRVLFGYPQPSHDEDLNVGLSPDTVLRDGRSVKQFREGVKKRKSTYLRYSRFGLGLMFVGFLVQGIAVWLA